MQFKAASLPRSSFVRQDTARLCQDHIDGFCRLGELCQRSHELCVLPTDEAARPALQYKSNYLFMDARLVGASFEQDGPGSLSFTGPRHDNDHVEIQHINILPTIDEILSHRPPYMPSRRPFAPHRLPHGQARLLDINFRQLRYENIESIIDCCYHASQELVQNLELQSHDYEFRAKTAGGHQYSSLRDVAFEELIFHENKGTMFRISFACPIALRGRDLGRTNILEEGMLTCLVGLENGSLSTTFMEVHMRQSTEAMRKRTGNDHRGKSTCYTPF